MKNLSIALLLAGTAWTSAHAATIYYEVENLGGDAWRYSYTLLNDSDSQFNGFSVFFDGDALLDPDTPVPGSPTGWDGFIAVDDPFLPATGFADWCLFDADAFDCAEVFPAVDAGDSLAGFSVDFIWAGIGTPGSQFFELYSLSFDTGCDPFFGCFDIVFEGETRPLPVTTPVPTPGAAALLAGGLLLLSLQRRRRLA